MFDDIRPYYDSEIPAAMQRIVSDPFFAPVVGFLFPGENPSAIADSLKQCQSIDDFQRRFMYPAVYSIIHNTTDGVTVEGLENLSPDKGYLYISNHRDIVLDAAILQVLLSDANLPTSEITFGANLMQGQFVIDVGKSNKMFRVERPDTVSSGREFLQKSIRLSEYIRHAIVERHESVWIAQRNGRTKDGNDQTDRGIISMLCQSGTEDRIASLAELNIVPISISYEWESCDTLKALELAARAGGEPYVKRPGEDLQSILTGITQKKGRVHIAVGKPISRQSLACLEGLSRADITTAVVNMIDRWVVSSYKLFPNNYIAYDILNDQESGHYTPEQKEAFLAHLGRLDSTPNAEAKKNILLGIYAAPVANKANYINL